MKTSKARRWGPIALVFVSLLVLGALIETAPSFQKCVKQPNDNQAKDAAQEEISLLHVPLARMELAVACSRVTAGENDGAITALATIVLAVFTFALWRSTDKLWLASERSDASQAQAMGQQLHVMTQQLKLLSALERPLLLPLAHRAGFLGWKHAGDKSRFPEIEINFKNYGRGPAIVEYARFAILISREPPTRVDGKKSSYAETRGDLIQRVYYRNHFWNDRAVAPGSDIGWSEVRYDHPLRPDQMDEIGTGAQRVWLDGFIAYADVAGSHRETHIKWVYDTDMDMMIMEGGAEFNRYT